MPIVNNKAIVDKSIDILSTLYKNILKKHHLQGSVDFSGLSEQIMNSLNDGSTNQIQQIIDQFVDNKIRNYDTIAGELALKADKSQNHRQTMDDLIGFSKILNSQCAGAISKNITIEKSNTQPSFRESLSNFSTNSSNQENINSLDDALRKNAEQLYKKTGQIPNGYILNEDGRLIKDENLKQHSERKSKETSIADDLVL